MIHLIIFITGASHTGKTNLAQKLLAKYQYPYLSLDHLKMGLIRSGNTDLTPMSSLQELTAYVWPIVREIAKTAIENHQNLIIEGCYIPYDWQKDFEAVYLDHIRCYCLVMSDAYIKSHYGDIMDYASVIEHRLNDDCSIEYLLAENAHYQTLAQQDNVKCILIDKEYDVDIDL